MHLIFQETFRTRLAEPFALEYSAAGAIRFPMGWLVLVAWASFIRVFLEMTRRAFRSRVIPLQGAIAVDWVDRF